MNCMPQPKMRPSVHLAPRYLLTLLFIFCSACALTAEVVPLIRAHSHNDYEHEQPLIDALDAGFCSVEADVFAIGEELLVAHDRIDLDRSRTLEALYLKPLQLRIKERGGKVYDQGVPFYLMIDFKTQASPTYECLRRIIRPYHAMLTRVDADGLHPGAVTLVISGNRPTQLVAQETERWVFIDGRLEDMEANRLPASLVPWISENWTSHFKWNGQGAMPQEEIQKLAAWLSKAHSQGRKVRFWATPETEAFWKLAWDQGLDFINTDQLKALSKVLLAHQAP